MTESDKELFKRALTEGISNRIDRQIAECTEPVTPSPAHLAAMRKIIKSSSKAITMRRLIAILVAAAMLLTGCAIVYRNEIRDFIEEIYESFVKVNFSDTDDTGKRIEDIYELTYIPEGYELEFSLQEPIGVRYTYVNSNGNRIVFLQELLDTTSFYADIENGYTQIVGISLYDVYCKDTKEHFYYMWNDGKYMFRLTIEAQISTAELKSIIEGIK